MEERREGERRIDAALRQQLPTGNGLDVAGHVVHLFRTASSFSGATVLVDDIEARIASGEKKYGTRLKTDNGRNATLDLYQEVLDGINYSMQNILERAEFGQAAVEPYEKIFITLVNIAIDVKHLLLAREEESNRLPGSDHHCFTESIYTRVPVTAHIHVFADDRSVEKTN